MLERPFTLEERGSVLTVAGAVDEFSVLQLRTAITERVDRGDVVVDLSDVDVLPSVGVGVLARVSEEARRDGRRVHLVAAADTIAQRVLQVCGLQYSHALPTPQEPTSQEPTSQEPGGAQPSGPA